MDKHISGPTYRQQTFMAGRQQLIKYASKKTPNLLPAGYFEVSLDIVIRYLTGKDNVYSMNHNGSVSKYCRTVQKEMPHISLRVPNESKRLGYQLCDFSLTYLEKSALKPAFTGYTIYNMEQRRSVDKNTFCKIIFPLVDKYILKESDNGHDLTDPTLPYIVLLNVDFNHLSGPVGLPILHLPEDSNNKGQPLGSFKDFLNNLLHNKTTFERDPKEADEIYEYTNFRPEFSDIREITVYDHNGNLILQ